MDLRCQKQVGLQVAKQVKHVNWIQSGIEVSIVLPLKSSQFHHAGIIVLFLNQDLLTLLIILELNALYLL